MERVHRGKIQFLLAFGMQANMKSEIVTEFSLHTMQSVRSVFKSFWGLLGDKYTHKEGGRRAPAIGSPEGLGPRMELLTSW